MSKAQHTTDCAAAYRLVCNECEEVFEIVVRLTVLNQGITHIRRMWQSGSK